MSMKIRGGALALVATIAAGCSSLQQAGGLQIRVANASAFTMEQVTIGFPSQEVQYGTLAAGATSEYRDVEQAYRYAAVTVMVEDERLVMQPIDFVGESLLAPGRYTYVLDVDSPPTRLNLTLRQDE